MWKIYAFFIGLSEAIGLLSGILTRNGMTSYELLEKPSLTPPAIVFPIVWSILYALMGVSAAQIRLTPDSQHRNRCLFLFLSQLMVNFFWSIFFFNLQAFLFSFIWLLFLWVLIFLMILCFYKVSKSAAWLQIPYLLWVTFAGYLNYMVWMLNQ